VTELCSVWLPRLMRERATYSPDLAALYGGLRASAAYPALHVSIGTTCCPAGSGSRPDPYPDSSVADSEGSSSDPVDALRIPTTADRWLGRGSRADRPISFRRYRLH